MSRERETERERESRGERRFPFDLIAFRGSTSERAIHQDPINSQKSLARIFLRGSNSAVSATAAGAIIDASFSAE